MQFTYGWFKMANKDLENCMGEYFMDYATPFHIKLYSLDEPEDMRFWHQYDKKELDDLESKKNGAFLSSFYERQIQEGGHWEEEAFYPKYRRKRDMGELPHKIIRMLGSCDCKSSCQASIDLVVKFTDGIVMSIKKEKY